jgi:hypothetical protein
MITGVDSSDDSDHAEHKEDAASKDKGRAFSLPRLLNDVYPGQSRSTTEPYLLEVACGPMGWIVDLTYKDSLPHVDAANQWRWMIEYVRSLVWRYGTYGCENAHEALGTLFQMWEGFPTGQFDRVHLSYAGGYMPDEDVARLFKELVRLCRARGTIRWVEGALPTTNSRACRRLFALAAQALAEQGRSFYRERPDTSFQATMETYMRDAGCQRLRFLPVGLDVSAGAVVHGAFAQEMLSTTMLLKPLLLRMRLVSNEEHTRLLKQLRQELREPSFHGTCYLYTAWGSV